MICVFKYSDIREPIMVIIGTIPYLLASLILIMKYRNLKSMLYELPQDIHFGVFQFR